MEIMRKLIAATAALALAMPVAVIPTAPAQAQSHYKGKSSKSRTYYKKCRRSSGTAAPRWAGSLCRRASATACSVPRFVVSAARSAAGR